MQSRWISISVMCFSAALLSACGGAPSGTALTSRSDTTAMSKADGRYDASSKGDDKDECDESGDHDKSADKSSLSVKSNDKDDDECKGSDDDHDQSKSLSSHSFSMSSKSDDDDANCKVTICHIPPGNHCNEHTIRVGKSAVRAHIAHGDYPGACDPQAPPQPPPPPPPPVCLPETAACSATGAACCTGLLCLSGVCSAGG